MILGLTGGIASGKSFVADCFVRCGASLVSADLLAREVVNPGSPTLDKLAEVFGADPDRHDEAMRVLTRHRPADGRAAAGAR